MQLFSVCTQTQRVWTVITCTKKTCPNVKTWVVGVFSFSLTLSTVHEQKSVLSTPHWEDWCSLCQLQKGWIRISYDFDVLFSFWPQRRWKPVSPSLKDSNRLKLYRLYKRIWENILIIQTVALQYDGWISLIIVCAQLLIAHVVVVVVNSANIWTNWYFSNNSLETGL